MKWICDSGQIKDPVFFTVNSFIIFPPKSAVKSIGKNLNIKSSANIVAFCPCPNSHFWSEIDRTHWRSMFHILFLIALVFSAFPINSYEGNNPNTSSISSFLSHTNDFHDKNTYRPLQPYGQWHQYPAKYRMVQKNATSFQTLVTHVSYIALS